MTNHDRTTERNEMLDLWVSRRVDGEVTSGDVPEELRDAVERRVSVASQLRHTLLQSQVTVSVDSATRDAHIARAMSRVRPARTSQSTVTRVAFGLAASFIAVLGVSVVITQQSDGRDETARDETLVAESMSSPVEDSLKIGTKPIESVSSVVEGMDQAAPPVDEEMYDAETLDSPAVSSLPQFDTVEEMTTFAARLDPLIPMTEGLNAIRVEPCVKTSAQAIEEILYQGRRVEVHIFATGVFQIYESETCSLLVERDTAR